ncbi:phosphocarrier protein HPr [Actinorhabdospora filicis]|uniref:Phosphocarrier protein HPr n=1 Tax=Actinorhabdospora filicis TaxID=1785913 RepID=A0A9W6SIH4_9ACTN|nr:HPr family phosphocarrier protein [Actinorhabdospora filicis]GLZ76893.1 phosphocarrier protein HPr [Actinorhabdospora filicis]
MAERQVKVTTDVGLHARPAAVFVQSAAQSSEDVTLAKFDPAAESQNRVNAKSILAVLGLDVRNGDEVIIASEDAEAVDRLAALVTEETS